MLASRDSRHNNGFVCIANRLLTATQNLLCGAKLSEYHTGYRAFHRRVLEGLSLEQLSEDFLFDKEYRHKSIFDAHSANEAIHVWRGEFGALPRYSWFTFNLTDAAGHSGGPHSDMIRAAIRTTPSAAC